VTNAKGSGGRLPPRMGAPLSRNGPRLAVAARAARQHFVGLVPGGGRKSRWPDQEDHDRGVAPQAPHRPMALRQGRRHSKGSEDEDGMETPFIALLFRAEAGGRRSCSRTSEGAVSRKGTAARNSFSRMPGSWSGIAARAGYGVGGENAVARIRANRSARRPEIGD
jgi:hypothetical protein